MKRTLLIAGAAAGCALIALATGGGEVSPKLKAFADALSSAQAFSATYVVQPIGGSPTETKIALAKPNKARIETAETLTIADGTTVSVYNKGENTYFKKPQTDKDLHELLSGMDTSLWMPFFKSDSVTKFAASKDMGTKSRGGKTLNVVNVQADPTGETTFRLYTDTSDNTLKQGEITVQPKGREAKTSVIQVTEQSFSAETGLFAFVAPNGAKEMDMTASNGEFGHDFEKALAMAKASGNLVMVDFMASWCGPCKMMDAEVFQSARFKKESKDFVLVKVDVDEQKAIAQKYGITAMPTVKFIRGDGSVVHEFVGYGGPEAVYGEMNTARSKK